MTYTPRAVAGMLGIAPTTLRTWDQRYGLGPSVRTDGGHRRYEDADVEVLRRMVVLTAQGISAAAAAVLAIVVWTGLATAGLAPSPAGLDRAFAPLAGKTAQWRMFLSRTGPELDVVSGLIWGLTPCPLVYIAIFNAMLLGSIEQSLVMMLAFGLITSIPVMVSALALYRASGLRTPKSRRIAGLALIGAGLLAVALTTKGSPLCIT